MSRTGARVVANTGAISLSLVAVTGASGIVAAIALGPEQRGLYAVGFGWLTLLASVPEAFVNHSATYFVANRPRVRCWVYRRLTWHSVVLGLALAAVFGLVVAAGIGNDEDYRQVALAFGAIIPLAGWASLPAFALLGLTTRLWNAVRVVQPLSYGAGVLVVAALHPPRVLAGLLVVLGISIGLQGAVGAFTWRRHGRLEGNTAGELETDAPEGLLPTQLMRFGVAAGLTGLPIAIVERAPILLLPLWATPATVGTFAVALSLTAAIAPFAVAVGQTAVPRLAASHGTARFRDAQRVVIRGGQVALLSGIMVGAGAGIVFGYVLGSAYGAGLEMAIALIIPGVLAAWNGVLRLVLRGIGKPSIGVVPQWVGVAVLFSSAWILGSQFGVAGVIAGMALAAAVTVGSTLFAMRRYFRDARRGSTGSNLGAVSVSETTVPSEGRRPPRPTPGAVPGSQQSDTQERRPAATRQVPHKR